MVNKLTVLFPFLTRPGEELHLAEIAKELGEAHTTVRLHLNRLVTEAFLSRRRIGNMTFYRLNEEHPAMLDLLIQAEKERLLTACEEPLFRELLTHLRADLDPATPALLFGSAVEGLGQANDIDLLLIGEERPLLNSFAKRYRKPLHLLALADLDRISSALRVEIIKKHLLINASERLVSWLWSRSPGAGSNGEASRG